MRRRLYKKNLFLEKDLPEVIQTVGPELDALSKLLPSTHPAEICARYILIFWKHKLQSNLIATRHRSSLVFGESEEGIRFFSEHGLRYFSEAARQALLNWRLDFYQLELRLDIPSFAEILDMQIEGRRCVSLIFDKNLLERYILGERDGASFAVHDLMHAQHFFANPEHFTEQVSFYVRAKALYERPDFKRCFQTNKDFEKQFQYAVSDMNTHPAHLEAYMNSICQQAGLQL